MIYLKIFLFILLYNGIEEINCSRIAPWFIYDGHLYYVEVNHAFTSANAEAKCFQLGMTATSTRMNAATLMPALREIYGDLIVFWTYRNQVLNAVFKVPQDKRSCFKLNSSDGNYAAEDCSSKFGILCKCRFTGATLFYKNGTIKQIVKKMVQQFCDPHGIVYDDVLSYCMINL